MSRQQALELLVLGVRKAQLKGAYTLEEAETLSQACRVFTVEDKPTTPVQSTPVSTPVTPPVTPQIQTDLVDRIQTL